MKRLRLLAAALLISCMPHNQSSGAGLGDAGPEASLDGGPLLPALDAGAGVSLSSACAPMIAKRCEYLVRCGLIADDPVTRALCAASFTATWCDADKWLARTLSPLNTLRFDARRAEACADAFAVRSCSEWATEPAACALYLQPNAQLRQTCYDGFSECVEGVCRGVSCGDRRCRSLGLAGEDCRAPADCQAGLYCRATAAVGVGVCSTPASVGDACTSLDECERGLTCIGQCLSLPPVGSPCVMGRCDSQGFCGVVDGVSSCVARVGLSQKCAADGQCASGLVCDGAKGVCVAALVQSVNAACGEKQACAGGLVCLGGPAGFCQAPLSAASPCTASSDCQAHLACVNGRCAARGLEGAKCASERDCGAFLGCVDAQCKARPVIGQACSARLPCVWGGCSSVGADAGQVCTDSLGPGAPCAHNTACASGLCAQGQCLAACTP